MMRHDDPAEHRAVAALLPWFHNGTLAAAEHRKVARHLAGCAACAAELAACDRLARAVRLADPLDAVGEASLAALHRRLDGAPERPGWRERFAAAWRGLGPRWVVFPGGAVAAALLLLLWRPIAPPTEYRTVTSLPTEAVAALPARVADGVPEAALRARLVALGLRVVDGPDAAGWYRLAPAGEAAAWTGPALQGLLAAPEFRFDGVAPGR